jgi:plasmid stabilization system protein ParE
MRVEWLKTALKNLEDEAAYIALDSPQSASDFIFAIWAAVEQLASFPAIGHEGRLAGTREWAMSDFPFIIPYRIRHGRPHIFRAFHTKHLPTVRR